MKHLIEVIGIPHTEVDLILVNNRLVGFDQKVIPDCKIEVFPAINENQNFLSYRLQKIWDTEPKFVLDNHLGQLAKYLRMLGFDSIYKNDIDDDEISIIASRDDRILLTRDVHLLMRKAVHHGYWVRSQSPHIQLEEVSSRYCLEKYKNPFKRCLKCNAELVIVEKKDIVDRLEPLTKKYYEDFKICPVCEKIYWKGSHYESMKSIINGLFQEIFI